MLRVALLVGGPSSERAISLNSARSVADHLDGEGTVVAPIIYFDVAQRAYAISREMLYSNTPGDFDFKLSRLAEPLNRSALAEVLSGCDLVFPAMHGIFGEDGGVQQLLEDLEIPYVGSRPAACRDAYDKFLAHQVLRKAGLQTIPSVRYPRDNGTACDGNPEDRDTIEQCETVVVKPTRGGSSLRVEILDASGRFKNDRTAEEPLGAKLLRVMDQVCVERESVVLQPYVTGTEFTTIVLEGSTGPVSLPPVEIERRSGTMLTYEHKYMPSDSARYYCPPRVRVEIVDSIRRAAEDAFRVLGLSDFARIDCWLDEQGQILISDVNLISGMEQNSHLFIQAAQIGMTHADVLRFVLSSACRRAGIAPPAPPLAESRRDTRLPIPVIFGGSTAERQVSVLSGTNVWLKLLKSERFVPEPYLAVDDEGDLWKLSYAVTLRHSVEQIADACEQAAASEALRQQIADDVAARLPLAEWQRSLPATLPTRVSREDLFSRSKFVFIALHGGAGENGTLQRELDRHGVAYNGCGPEASALCMDKYETGERLKKCRVEGITTARRVKLTLDEIRLRGVEDIWHHLIDECGSTSLIVKPIADGCSAGVAPLMSAVELRDYIDAASGGADAIQPGVFRRLAKDQAVALPSQISDLIFEEFIETDDVLIIDSPVPAGGTDAASAEPAYIQWGRSSKPGWIEVTVGVVGTAGNMRALSPSMTIAREGVLSVQEKFMGGTGVNITPPPVPPLGPVRASAILRTKELISRTANILGICGYARIDAFMNYMTGDVTIIEANTLPGLTPSTVLYHQALYEDQLFPRQLLEQLIDLGMEAEKSS